ncbi:MAG TPA: SDR family oxidoreductase [Hyphomonadaceae bacterium]|nr:SDR family oxidoreductase [Hyphomonadaceae bacterium]
MRIFLTGATGFVGTMVASDLKAAGHDVLGMARNDAGAEMLKSRGVAVHRGELTDHASLVAGAKACDGVIHTAFVHDFTKFEQNIEIDRQAVAAMIGALEGTNKPLVIASGTGLLGLGATGAQPLGTEKDLAPGELATRGRAATEGLVRDAAKRGVRSSIVRLPPTVHGKGDKGFVPMMIDLSRKGGQAGYIGEGVNRWPAVHRIDAARVFRLAAEKGAPGSTFHAVAEEGIPMRVISEAIGKGLGLPVRSLSMEQAQQHFGWFTMFTMLDNPSSSAWSRQTLGWQPKEIGLLQDMSETYFS